MLEYGIGLTGGIASGKSCVSTFLAKCGFEIIDADLIAHQTLDECKEVITGSFGDQILENGVINRKILGEIIFNDANKKKLLESLLHPKIRQKILLLAQDKESKNYPYFLDIPLFFESGGREKYPVKLVLCIVCSPDVQKKRLMARNQLTESQATLRIRAQLPIDQKCSKSDFVITNNKSLESLQSEVLRFLQNLKLFYPMLKT